MLFNYLKITLACVGGLVGIAAASLFSMMLTRMMAVPYAFNVSINLLSFFFSAAIGIIFGFIPAWCAVKLNPIVALGHE